MPTDKGSFQKLRLAADALKSDLQHRETGHADPLLSLLGEVGPWLWGERRGFCFYTGGRVFKKQRKGKEDSQEPLFLQT